MRILLFIGNLTQLINILNLTVVSCQMDSKYDDQAEQNARLWMEDVTGTLLCNPPDDIETADQLNEWRYNNPLGKDGMCCALSDGRYLCM